MFPSAIILFLLILLLLAYLLHRRRITKLTSDKRGNLPDSQPISQPYIVNSMSSLFSSFPSSCSEMGGYAQVKTSRISDFPNPNGSQVLSISATTAYFEPPISSRREDSACYWSSTIIDSRNPRHSTTLTTATNYENKDFIRVLTKNRVICCILQDQPKETPIMVHRASIPAL
uniref:Uncharacterized protein n=1 Tax=Ditylenchus dipsaci TaxID=166011 RepID=A0A915EG08_9BILA